MYSVFCALALIFVVFIVPETRGKDLDDIAKLFVKNRRQSQQSNSGAINKAFNNSVEHLAVATVMNDTNGLNKQQSSAKSNGTNGINGNVNDSDITKL